MIRAARDADGMCYALPNLIMHAPFPPQSGRERR